MKKVVNKRTRCTYVFKERKDYVKTRVSLEKFHLKATPLAIRVARFLRRFDESKRIAFLHYVMNQLGMDYDEEIRFYQAAIEKIRMQKVINEIYFQQLYDFPSLSEPRDLEHLKRLRG